MKINFKNIAKNVNNTKLDVILYLSVILGWGDPCISYYFEILSK